MNRLSVVVNHKIQPNSLQNATKEIAMETLPLKEPFLPTYVSRRHQLTRAIMHNRMHHQVFQQASPFMYIRSKAWLSTRPQCPEYTTKFRKT